MKKNNTIWPYPNDLDKFLIEVGTRKGKDKGKLKDFFEIAEHPGWYAFVFEHGGLHCTIDCGLQLGLFVKCGPNTVKLNPELEDQLDG